MEWQKKVPIRTSELAWRVIDGEAVVMPLKNQLDDERMYIFNKTATKIFELVDGKNRIADIIEELLKEYDVEPREVELRVKHLIKKLVYKQLVDLL